MAAPFLWLAYFTLAAVAWALLHDDAVRRIRRWIQGVQGEQEVQELIAELESGGYQLFHGVKVRGGTVAHVAIGPAGVFAIQTKSWWPFYVSLRDRFLNGEWERDHGMRELRRACAELRDRLRAVGIEEGVEALLILTRVGLPSGPVRLSSVTMLDVTNFLPFVLTRSERLSPNQITMAAEAIRGGIPVAAAATTSSQTQTERPVPGTDEATHRGSAPEGSSTAERRRPGRRARSPEQSSPPPARV